MNDDEAERIFKDMYSRASPEARLLVDALLSDAGQLPPKEQEERGRQAARILRDDLGRKADEN